MVRCPRFTTSVRGAWSSLSLRASRGLRAAQGGIAAGCRAADAAKALVNLRPCADGEHLRRPEGGSVGDRHPKGRDRFAGSVAVGDRARAGGNATVIEGRRLA